MFLIHLNEPTHWNNLFGNVTKLVALYLLNSLKRTNSLDSLQSLVVKIVLPQFSLSVVIALGFLKP